MLYALYFMLQGHPGKRGLPGLIGIQGPKGRDGPKGRMGNIGPPVRNKILLFVTRVDHKVKIFSFILALL